MRVARLLAPCVVVGLLLATSCSLFRSSLEVEAQIIYNMGGPQPVARQTLYLVDRDVLSIRFDEPEVKAKQEQFKTDEEKTLFTMQGMNLLLLKMLVEKRNEIKDEKQLKEFLGALELSKPFWADHIVQTAQTDFKGKATFTNLKSGQYWILAITETRAAIAVWNHKVNLQSGENKVLLDQNNALYSK